MEKYVYFFGGGKADGNGTMKDVLGGKGSGLAEMTNAGLPVPPGFTIVTSACRLYFHNSNQTPAEILSQKDEALVKLQTATARFCLRCRKMVGRSRAKWQVDSAIWASFAGCLARRCPSVGRQSLVRHRGHVRRRRESGRFARRHRQSVCGRQDRRIDERARHV